MPLAVITPINIGGPPLLWSTINDAFELVNENFTHLAEVNNGASSLSLLVSDVIPDVTNHLTIGNVTSKWKRIYAQGWTEFTEDEGNGIWIDNAQIKGIGNVIDLPANSTVNGVSIINSNFETIALNGTDVLTSLTAASKIKLNSGTGISLAVDNLTHSVSISNTGIISITPGTGISASTTNGISTISNTGIISITPGTGIGVTTANGISTISNLYPIIPLFTKVKVPGFDDIIADSSTDSLTFQGNSGITVTANSFTDTITISSNPVQDIHGSIFAHDSSLLVDATTAQIVGTVNANITRQEELVVTAPYIKTVGKAKASIQSLTGLTTGNVTLTNDIINSNILAGTPNAHRIVTLPVVTTEMTGVIITVINYSNSFRLTVNDSNNVTITVLDTNYPSQELFCNGTSWMEIL